MKIKAGLLLIFVFTIALSACSSGNSPSSKQDNMIEPGDKVGDFLITIGEQGKFTYGFNVTCSEPGANNTYSCTASVGDIINVSTGMYDTTGKGTLDEVWAHSNYQIYINDRPVDLQAFGTIDYNHPQVGVIRFANVVITTDKPGQITVRDSGVYDNGDAFSSTSTYEFIAP
jgi:hypothetical protein